MTQPKGLMQTPDKNWLERKKQNAFGPRAEGGNQAEKAKENRFVESLKTTILKTRVFHAPLCDHEENPGFYEKQQRTGHAAPPAQRKRWEAKK